MHHKKKRRRELILRVLTYILMTSTVLGLSAVCIFLVLGYSVDEKTGKAEQGGLIQYRSFPEGATITLDGSKQSTLTPFKTNTSAGYHSVAMKKDKYREWSKNTKLKAGELLWLNALLVPSSLTTDSIETFEALSSSVASPDKKWIAAVGLPSESTISLIDLRDEKKPKRTSLRVPESIVGEVKPGDTFSVQEWDFGSRYLLVTHQSGDKVSWLRLDRTDEKNAKNITNDLGIPITDQHFAGTSGNVLYALTEGTLRKLDLGQNTISSPVASGVEKFELYKDNILAYVAKTETNLQAGYYREGQKKPTVVAAYDQSQPIDVAVSSYYDDAYYAITRGDSLKIIKSPDNTEARKTIASITAKQPLQWVYFSYNGQFVVAQTGSNLTSYNLERDESFNFTIPGNPKYTSEDHLKWLDDFHLWSDQGGNLVIFEFDGANPETISAVAPGYSVSLSDNGKRLFSIGAQGDTTRRTLQSSVMVIE